MEASAYDPERYVDVLEGACGLGDKFAAMDVEKRVHPLGCCGAEHVGGEDGFS
jgi:hypothetical protein